MFDKIIERKNLKNNLEKNVLISDDMKKNIQERIEKIEQEIEIEVSEDQMNEVIETLRELGGKEDSIRGDGRQKMWKMLKKITPKCCLQFLWVKGTGVEI